MPDESPTPSSSGSRDSLTKISSKFDEEIVDYEDSTALNRREEEGKSTAKTMQESARVMYPPIEPESTELKYRNNCKQ